jgi:hypothetical protein
MNVVAFRRPVKLIYACRLILLFDIVFQVCINREGIKDFDRKQF